MNPEFAFDPEDANIGQLTVEEFIQRECARRLQLVQDNAKKMVTELREKAAQAKTELENRKAGVEVDNLTAVAASIQQAEHSSHHSAVTMLC